MRVNPAKVGHVKSPCSALLASALAALLLAGLAASAAEGQGFGVERRKLTIGGAFVDALVDFQRFGGDVDEVTPGDLIGRPAQTFGLQHGRSIFAVGSGEPGDVVGIVTADGGAVKASMTPDGFIQLQPASAGFNTRNSSVFRALYGDKDVPAYTEEVILEYIDDSGARLLMGGAEVNRTTAYLFKKDRATGEIIFRVNRDILSEKPSGNYLDPDVSSTFPMKFKFCDPNRLNCVTRNIVKKPGDEIRLDPATRRVNITFNKDNLPYHKKYKTAQRLSWACEYNGQGFHFTYREGSLGGHNRPGRNETGILTCNEGVLKCERTGPGQKCNFDFRDYLSRPAEAALFGLDWLVARKDPHTHYFTIAPNEGTKRHIRVGNLKNLGTIREVTASTGGGTDTARDGEMDSWVAERLQQALCGGEGYQCPGLPPIKVIEVTGVNDGLDFIDERTGTKLKNVERARLYSLQSPYGWGKQDDFVAALIQNKQEAAEVVALKRLNDELQAPGLLETENPYKGEENPVKAMIKGLEEEQKLETMKVKLSESSQALVIFPTTHIEDLKGILGLPVTSPPAVPAKILSISTADNQPAHSYGQPSGSPARQPLPPTLPNY